MRPVSFLLLCLAACTPEAAPGPTASKSPDAPPAVPRGPVTDPEVGDFTLEEATAGLPPGKTLRATIATPKGSLTCELFADRSPVTVASFVGLARGIRPFFDPEIGDWVKRPYYDGQAFHRVIPDFMIQGGDVRSRDYAHPHLGTGGPGYRLIDERHPSLEFDRAGRMAVANSGPGTGGSQFFVTETKQPSLDGNYTIFGQCKEIAVVKAIARVPRDDNDKPKEAVRMNVTITRQ
jgi:peptidyl-prolyl cis-trans isomerase A (cyclophilin A)